MALLIVPVINPIVLTGLAVALITTTLGIQSSGMALLIVWGRARFARTTQPWGPVRGALLMVRITSIMVGLHLLEILLWGAFYRWKCFPSWEASLYFSATNFSTVGYGDLVLPAPWRLLAPTESLIGILMCGLSASFLFAVVTILIQHQESHENKKEHHSEAATHL